MKNLHTCPWKQKFCILKNNLALFQWPCFFFNTMNYSFDINMIFYFCSFICKNIPSVYFYLLIDHFLKFSHTVFPNRIPYCSLKLRSYFTLLINPSAIHCFIREYIFGCIISTSLLKTPLRMLSCGKLTGPQIGGVYGCTPSNSL